jgi:cytochrome P450 family 4
MIEKVENFVDSRFILQIFQKVFTYFSPITLIFTTLVTMWIVNYNRKRARMVRLIDKIPGPPALPFIGEFVSVHQF